MEKAADISGQVFGALTVIKRFYRNYPGIFWECRCTCGVIKSIGHKELVSGIAKTCGCFIEGLRKPSRLSHGHCQRSASGERNESKEYMTWVKLRGRCYNINDPKYPNYGGRGIRVCERWINSFENFIADMGKAPSKTHSIDRINNDGNYEPSNCRWATPREQSLNKSNNVRLECNGITLTQKEWEERNGFGHGTIRSRLKLGWSVERAITEPVRK